jgi:uncharacterized protein YgfB (UPF0149 family)
MNIYDYYADNALIGILNEDGSIATTDERLTALAKQIETEGITMGVSVPQPENEDIKDGAQTLFPGAEGFAFYVQGFLAGQGFTTEILPRVS